MHLLYDIANIADAVKAIHKDLPKARDGLYDYEARPSNEFSSDYDSHSTLYVQTEKYTTDVKRGPIFGIQDVYRTIELLKSPGKIDDRTHVFNEFLYKASRINDIPFVDGEAIALTGKILNNVLVNVLYNTIPHPPSTFVGTQYLEPGDTADPLPSQLVSRIPNIRIPFAYRSADGSGNNPMMPNIGKSGMPYARTVQSKHPLAYNSLPDPDLIFDALLREREWKPHPNGNSSLTFAYASLVTHQLFRTDYSDPTKTRNNATSYLDLSILYGNNQHEQDSVRDREQGRGLLYPDAYAEDRLGMLPPASSALVVVFSRNHNYIAKTLLNINEKQRWTDPPPEDLLKRRQQDEEIFQIARNVNCGHYMSTIFGDYVNGFLGMTRDGNSWSIQPFDPIKTPEGVVVGRGEGNHVSVEFNLLYRWHPTASKQDTAWSHNLMQGAFPDRSVKSLSPGELGHGIAKLLHSDPNQINPRTRTFAGLKRQKDGSFSDDDIARVLQNATSDAAGAFGARRTPEIFRAIEVLGIKQGREWGVCTMNEFREYLGLKRFDDFEEWNSDPVIAEAARTLYGHIDNLELYAGLQAEEIILPGPGSGLCCGYTMTRAILGDAIGLVRGDRFYTTEFTPANLTVWGYQDCARQPENGAYGAALPRLLLRHLPRHYTYNSTYALFPFFTPEQSLKNLKKLGCVDQYDFERPDAHPTPVPKSVNTLAGIKHVFAGCEKYKVVYGADMDALTNNRGFMLTFDEKEKHDKARKEVIWHALWPSPSDYTEFISFFRNQTISLLKENSYSIDGVPGKRVDIVNNVINLVSVRYAADYMMGFPLKTKSHPQGLMTEQELYKVLALLCTCVFINVLPENGWLLRTGAKKVSALTNEVIRKSLIASNPRSSIFGKAARMVFPEEQRLCYPFLRRLAELGLDTDTMIANVIALTVGSTVNYAQAVTQVVDFYLDDEQASEREEIVKLAHRDDKESMELLRGYVREAMRLRPQFPGLLRQATQADFIPDGAGKTISVQPGDIIFASFLNAQQNPADFPNPQKVDPRRPKEKYRNQGDGFHGCPGVDFVNETVPEMVKVIFKLKNLRRAPGVAGRMAGFSSDQIGIGTESRVYLTNTGQVSPWPGSMTVIYDEEYVGNGSASY